MKATIVPGSVVFSKKGRDKTRCFVVLLSVDADFVMLADGDTRKLDHLKKKRRKHLSAAPVQLDGILSMYRAGQLKDSDIRKALAPYRADSLPREAQELREG